MYASAKGDFPGRAGLLKQKQEGVPRVFRTIEIEAEDAGSFGNGPVFVDGELVGRGTAGGCGHHVGKSLMLGYVRSDVAEIGQGCHARILDRLLSARIIADSPYDPEKAALRA